MKLSTILLYLIENGVSLVGRVKQVADLLHPGHALTNDEINTLELAAQADDDKRIAARTADDAG